MVDHNQHPQAFRLPCHPCRRIAGLPVTTLPEAIELEPQIGILLDQAKHVGNATWNDYERFKGELAKLAGWYAGNPRLATEHAYGLVIDALTEALEI